MFCTYTSVVSALEGREKIYFACWKILNVSVYRISIYFPRFKERILKVELKVLGVDMGCALVLGVEWNNNF